MKIRKKLIIGILAISMACIILQPNKSNAALQSNGGTPATKTINNWILQIRQMQELGGTLGRTDDISKTDLTSNSTELDIHMEKNTEYGAMAILSASAYGNPNKINDGETTTGNSTGIVVKMNKELVAANANSTSNSSLTKVAPNFNNASGRYKNLYSSSYVAKIGDAILNWHGSTSSNWTSSDSQNGVLIRSFSGSIFSYYARGCDNSNYGDPKYAYNKPFYSRAAIVVGTGI